MPHKRLEGQVLAHTFDNVYDFIKWTCNGAKECLLSEGQVVPSLMIPTKDETHAVMVGELFTGDIPRGLSSYLMKNMIEAAEGKGFAFISEAWFAGANKDEALTKRLMNGEIKPSELPKAQRRECILVSGRLKHQAFIRMIYIKRNDAGEVTGVVEVDKEHGIGEGASGHFFDLMEWEGETEYV